MLSESERAWWLRKDIEDTDEAAHEKLLTIVRDIERTQSYRKRAHLMHGAIYGDVPVQGLQVDSYTRTTPGGESSLSLNVSRSVVDAVVARVYVKGTPHLSYATEGADYEKQHEAEQLERGVEGVFEQQGHSQKATERGRQACIFGTGILRIEPDWDTETVNIRKEAPWERLIDDTEMLYENEEPRCQYTHRYWDKYVLLHYVRKHMEKLGGDPARVDLVCTRIERIEGERDDDAEFGYQQRSLRVSVYEGWHRSSGRGATDGRYVWCVRNVPIIDRAWDEHEEGNIPISRLCWSRAVVGWYGQGIVEQGKGIQREINKLVRQIQNGHHLITGKWVCPADAKVVATHINNDLSTILRYSGPTPPTYQAPTIIAPEMYQHLWNLCTRYYELASVNQQAAAAQVPAGMESGEAQRVYADQQTSTLLQRGRDHEDACKRDGQLVARAAKALANESVYEVRSTTDDGFETIDWAKLDDPDGYELRVTPTSQLPGTISEKIDLAYDLMKLGDIDNVDVMEIIGMADILRTTQRKLAWMKRVEMDIGIILREGRPRIPDALIGNLVGAFALALSEYNRAITKNVPDERLQLVRNYLVALKALIPPPPPPTPQAMAPGHAGPPQGATPPPASAPPPAAEAA